ncbi:MAG: glutathione peroxidase [Alphaproteobacteria bacterium]|jgi:glutathione peroxidase|nr:glutathione peroxidase [Rhodospirillaceae bacterium]MBT7646996.1 glutathione peroxidase [Rhodospirillaceae bacterium]MDG2481491.1 glutathione peroxidase [Alphaproteobacteria bacterium]
MSAHEFSFPGRDGGNFAMAGFAGKAVLVINVASACGYTPQYKGMQALWQARAADGVVVLGVPSNEFGKQEPGSEAEIKTFCECNFGINFPMTAKQTVLGEQAHPFYRWIVAEAGESAAPKWNFHKYLIGPDGELAGVWPSSVEPDSSEIASAIDACLKD